MAKAKHSEIKIQRRKMAQPEQRHRQKVKGALRKQNKKSTRIRMRTSTLKHCQGLEKAF